MHYKHLVYPYIIHAYRWITLNVQMCITNIHPYIINAYSWITLNVQMTNLMNTWSYTDLWMKCPPPTDSDTSPFLHLVRWFVYRLPHWTHLLENLKNLFSKEFKFIKALVPNTLGITPKQKGSPGGSFSKLIVKKQVLKAYLIFQIFYFFSWFKNLENSLV